MRVAVVTALLVFTAALRGAESSSHNFAAEDLARGQKMFVVHCARCHGMQGFGGTGPNLARPTLTHATDLKSLIAVIESGIPGTGMPSAWVLPRKDREAVAAFVKTLGVAAEVPVPGSPVRGSELFTRAACTQCHTVGGQGGVRGPDLSEVGNRRGAERLRKMLVEPGADKGKADDGFTEYLPVKITTVTGREVEGLRVNEDGFTIQVRDLENRIHSFRKSDVKDMTKGSAKASCRASRACSTRPTSMIWSRISPA